MARKARQEAPLNYAAVGAALLGLSIMVVAAMMPFWLVFPAYPTAGWPLRNWGLMKISGRYTNVMIDGADLTWIQVRDSVCAASQMWTTGVSGGTDAITGAMGMASAIGAQLAGANCGNTCKLHLGLRCQIYYKFTSMSFAVLGMMIAGGLCSLIGAGMPLIGKERKRDRATWLSLNLLGFLLSAGACALHWFIFDSSLNQLRLTSWFQQQSLGWAFMMACAGAGITIVPVLTQLSKVLNSKDKKDDSSAQLLTAGASPDFMMPSAI